MTGVGRYGGSQEFGRRLERIATAERSSSYLVQPRAASDEARWRVPSLASTLAGLLVVVAMYFGGAYLKTRYVCQSFKDTGRFYYGMDVPRCIGILIDDPFASMSSDLGKLNRSYARPPKG